MSKVKLVERPTYISEVSKKHYNVVERKDDKWDMLCREDKRIHAIPVDFIKSYMKLI